MPRGKNHCEIFTPKSPTIFTGFQRTKILPPIFSASPCLSTASILCVTRGSASSHLIPGIQLLFSDIYVYLWEGNGLLRAIQQLHCLNYIWENCDRRIIQKNWSSLWTELKIQMHNSKNNVDTFIMKNRFEEHPLPLQSLSQGWCDKFMGQAVRETSLSSLEERASFNTNMRVAYLGMMQVL